jgi:hypothetical protein
MPYSSYNNIALSGNYSLLRSIEIINFNVCFIFVFKTNFYFLFLKDKEHIPCPFSLHFNDVIKNKTRIAFRGIINNNAKIITFSLLHDAPRMHEFCK